MSSFRALLLAVLVSTLAYSAPTLISHTKIGGPSPVISPAIDTTGATFLCVTINNFFTDPATATVSDSKGNTFSKTASHVTAGGEANTIIFYCWSSCIVGTSHTVTVTIASFPGITFSAFSGVKTSANPLDQQNGAFSNTGVSTIATGSITPSANGTLIVTSVGSGGSLSSGFSINSGFTIIEQLPYAGGNNEANASAYLVQGSAAAVNPTWTWTAGNSAAVVIASFLPAPSSGTFKSLMGVGK